MTKFRWLFIVLAICSLVCLQIEPSFADTSSTTSSIVLSSSTTTTTNAEQCPTSVPARITGLTYTINGTPGFTKLAGNIKSGDKVTANFTVAADCSDQVFSFVAYEAQNGTFDQTNIVNQTLFSHDSGTFGAGAHALSITVPNCYFQVDFVSGFYITTFGPIGSDNFYGSRVIDTAQGGSACEVTTESTIRITTTTFSTSTSSIAKIPADTEDVSAVNQLAFTGISIWPIAVLGVLLFLFGVGFYVCSSLAKHR